MNIKQRIGQRIRELRAELQLSQEAVAYKAEIDRTFMTHVENGRRNVSVETLEKIIYSGLEMDFKDFFNNDLFQSKSKRKGEKA